ncbi:MAG: reverse transcriptase domain-containing protein [Pseudomonadota bacterium]|nr:reverse transcriptase domain-containing protein [Pseudomonadota bacterium]
MKSLYDEMRSEQNLFSAWRHVKRSALNSANNDIKGLAAEFEFRHQTYLRTIGTQLRENRFRFDEAIGVLKDKKKREAQNKAPRPIAVATLRNRVVQRAILQVLQPRRARDRRDVDTRFETMEDERLGKINLVNKSDFGVGGLLKPYGGVGPAIKLISTAINNGSRHYYQSDIKSFFTKIPTQTVIDFVRRETNDERLSQIFSEGLEVHLSNKDELTSYAKLFPSGGIGVAQGSSLSAFAGNVLLYDLDHELNSESVTAVRYIDDLLMVAKNKEDLDRAVLVASQRLKGFGFQLYEPVPRSEKAAYGVCGDTSISFLGCMLQPNRCVQSASSIQRVHSDVTSTLRKSKFAINQFISHNKRLNAEHSESATIHSLGKKLYGWKKSFSFCTDQSPFEKLDQDVLKSVSDYKGFVRRKCANATAAQRTKIFGLPILAEI